jgi:hypothetical protein
VGAVVEMSGESEKLYAFPRILRVSLHSFSLYSLKPNMKTDLPAGVLCMAGANGIGKSTFLSTVNYALTGAVPHPKRRLLSASAYYKDATAYANEYFTGRIAEQDRDEAAVTIEFEIGEKHFALTRGLLDPEDVRALSINGNEVDPGAAAGYRRSSHYRDEVTRCIGLTAFEQFVFLQHFVFTFDEARNLLFWNEQATALTLFLCFGGDPTEAERADLLQREAEKAGSRGRNAQYQANNTRKRITTIEGSMGAQGDTSLVANPDLDAEYDRLDHSVGQALELHEKLEAKLGVAENEVIQSSALSAQLRASYNDLFNDLLHRFSKVEQHPIVLEALRDSTCGVCSACHPDVAVTVKSRLDSGRCPLCDTPLNSEPGDQDALRARLADIDAKLAEARHRQDSAVAVRDRLSTEIAAARANLMSARAELHSFEENNGRIAEVGKARRALMSGPVARTLEALRSAEQEFIDQRNDEYALRDHHREELRKLQKGLELRYALAEETFVPRFRELAGLFLGIDLDISLQMTAPIGMKFVVEMRGSERHGENEMSESQRFFVDIALRMALVGQMSMSDAPATLFIDTPEGSLDIAYEERAGEMFARFVERGNNILMTANINSSKLLTTLAKRCGTRSMAINEMTTWTELSEVQQKAAGAFAGAYRDIAAALAQGPAN